MDNYQDLKKNSNLFESLLTALNENSKDDNNESLEIKLVDILKNAAPRLTVLGHRLDEVNGTLYFYAALGSNRKIRPDTITDKLGNEIKYFSDLNEYSVKLESHGVSLNDYFNTSSVTTHLGLGTLEELQEKFKHIYGIEMELSRVVNEDMRDAENIEYTLYDSKGKITESIEMCDKAVAEMTSGQSAKFTKMVNDLQAMKSEMADLKERISDQEDVLRENIANHFDEAFNGVATMTIRTCKNIITLARGKKQESVRYAEVLKEFEKELTPDLRQKLEETKKRYTTTTDKKSALTIRSVTGKKKVNESVVSKIVDNIKKFANMITRWTKSYSNKMEGIMKQADAVNEGKRPLKEMKMPREDYEYIKNRMAKNISKQEAREHAEEVVKSGKFKDLKTRLAHDFMQMAGIPSKWVIDNIYDKDMDDGHLTTALKKASKDLGFFDDLPVSENAKN